MPRQVYLSGKKNMDEKKFTEFHQRQKESGLTVKEFCSNEIIAPSTFYYWQKKLRSRNRLPGFIPVLVNTAPNLSQGNFLGKSFPPTIRPTNNSIPIEIEFSNKTVLRISSELDLSVIKALIHLND
jgi:hypothetical protein